MSKYQPRRDYAGELDPKKLKKARENVGLSQEQLAEKMKMDRTKICRYEAGETKRPQTATLLAFCEALNCDKNDLLSPVTAL